MSRVKLRNAITGALTVVLLVVSLGVEAQQPKSAELKVDSGLFVYEKIESVELSRREIIGYAAAFLAEKFKSSKSVIELRDEDLGKIVGDVILKDEKAGMFDAFKEIKARIILDAKHGRYRLQATNLVGLDGNGNTTFGKIEGANQYRLEPLALNVLPPFADELKAYLTKAKASRDF